MEAFFLLICFVFSHIGDERLLDPGVADVHDVPVICRDRLSKLFFACNQEVVAEDVGHVEPQLVETRVNDDVSSPV